MKHTSDKFCLLYQVDPGTISLDFHVLFPVMSSVMERHCGEKILIAPHDIFSLVELIRTASHPTL